MSHPKLSRARHEQGLQAYRAGHGVDHLWEVSSEMEAMHRQPDLTDEQHEEIASAVPSFVAGYMTGLIEDIRSLAGNPAIARRGQTA